MQIAKRITKITAIVLLGILAFLILLNFIIHLLCIDFFLGSERVGKIAGLGDGLVPQGIDYVDGVLLTAGYKTDNSPSVVYAESEGKQTKTELYKANGDAYTRHAGGITHFGEYAYLAGSSGLDVFSLDDILSGKSKTSLMGTVKTYNDPAWCTTYGGYIFAGSFAQAGNESYPPEQSETLTTPSGDTNVSIITVFELGEEFAFGVNPEPVAVLSTGEKVQGCCLYDDGSIILSTSYSVAPSKFFFHRIDTAKKDGDFTLGATEDFEGYTVPLIYLDSSTLTKTLTSIPMAEEIIIIDGRMYVMNESACGKYVFGNLIGGIYLYAYEIKAEYFK